MSLNDNVQISLVVLFTGLIVVFAMLIFLTLIIKLYGNIIHGISDKKKKPPRPADFTPAVPAAKPVVPAPLPKPVQVVEEGIPQEVVAAIAAAVECTYGSGSCVVKSVKRAVKSARSAWGTAGLLENTRPF